MQSRARTRGREQDGNCPSRRPTYTRSKFVEKTECCCALQKHTRICIGKKTALPQPQGLKALLFGERKYIRGILHQMALNNAPIQSLFSLCHAPKYMLLWAHMPFIRTFMPTMHVHTHARIYQPSHGYTPPALRASQNFLDLGMIRNAGVTSKNSKFNPRPSSRTPA